MGISYWKVGKQLQTEVYPSSEELMPRSLLSLLPQTLVEEIEIRYRELGTKYLSGRTWPDGRQINNMLFTDRMINCREELVDAVFCILGQIFKDIQHGDDQPNDVLYDMLSGLIAVYSMCVAMEENGLYTNVSIEA